MGLIINPRQIIKDGITSLRDVWSSSKVSTELSGKQATLVSGTNIKTINNTSLLGSGDIHISGGGDIPRINMTATTAMLDPNKFYVWGEVASLDISLAAETAGIENVYKFQFQSGSTATTLTLPSSVKWSNTDISTLKNLSTYIVSIESGIAKIERYYRNSPLPAEYRQVEYLRCTGTQYLNTGITAIGTYTYNATLRGVLNKRWGFGSRINFNERACGVWKENEDSTDVAFFNYYGAYQRVSDSRFNDGQTHSYSIDAGALKIDGETIASFSASNFNTTMPMYVMAVCKNNSAEFIFQGDILEYEIKMNDIYVLHLLPCYRIADNVAGAFDLTNDTFLTNAGTGDFIVGPDV